MAFSLPFYKKEQLNQDTFTFYFRRNGSEKEFKPGQYFEVKLPIEKIDDRGDARVFTISSSPTNKDFFTITTRIIQSSFKKTLLNLQNGTPVSFEGPWDDIEVNLNDPSPKVFLAGGIGITPFHSIVEFCSDMKLDIPMTLFASWSKREDVIFDDFFKRQEKVLSKFKYIPSITKDIALSDWSGERGRINQSVIERHVVNIDAPTYYIVGPGEFIKGMENLLLGMSITQEKIIFEHFSGY